MALGLVPHAKPLPPALPTHCTLHPLLSTPTALYTHCSLLEYTHCTHSPVPFFLLLQEMAGRSPEEYLVAAAKLHGVSMAVVDRAARDVVWRSMPAFAIVRPQGKASPPAGFVCTNLATALHHAAVATQQTNASVVTRGGYNAMLYKGRGMEAALARAEAPTCTRLLVNNPCNANIELRSTAWRPTSAGATREGASAGKCPPDVNVSTPPMLTVSVRDL